MKLHQGFGWLALAGLIIMGVGVYIFDLETLIILTAIIVAFMFVMRVMFPPKKRRSRRRRDKKES